jgi:hypothetical protein
MIFRIFAKGDEAVPADAPCCCCTCAGQGNDYKMGYVQGLATIVNQ